MAASAKPGTRKLGVPVVAALVLAALAWAFVPKALEVDVGTVTRGSLEVTVDEEGKTRARERYLVSAPLTGRLRRIELRAGDSVTRNETVLAVVDPTDPALLDARAIAEAEARVRAASATRDRAGPGRDRAASAHDLAAKELGRAKTLFETEVLSKRELDDAENRERIAAADLKAARFAGEVADYELEVAKAALVRTRPGGGGSGFEVRSPIDGKVLRRFEESEKVVAPGAALLEIADPADLEVVIDVLSSDAVRVRPGARVVLEHWGGERPLAGRVRVVEPGGFTKVSALGVEEQRVNVVADLVDPPEARATLGDGYRVDARILVSEADAVLKIPGGALFRRGEEWSVFGIERGRARLTRVAVGRQNGEEAEVSDGLSEGQQVVLYPSDRIEDGVKVSAR